MKALVVSLGLIVSAVGVYFSVGRPTDDAKPEAFSVEPPRSTKASSCPCSATQASEDPRFAAAEDPKRCGCWYSGYDDNKAGKKIDDPDSGRNDCDLAGLKTEYLDGWKAARDGDPRKCPYKK